MRAMNWTTNSGKAQLTNVSPGEDTMIPDCTASYVVQGFWREGWIAYQTIHN